MVIYYRNDLIKCLTFFSSLKGAASDWFYSLPSLFIHNLTLVTKAFLIQYASYQEAKWNSHHLLLIELRQEDSLKLYINFFQSQLTKISNCGEEVSTLAFISRLEVTHSLYKHILKHNAAKISEVLSRAQPYILLEEAMKASSNRWAKPGDGEAKSKSLHEAFDHIQDRFWGQSTHKRQAFPILPPNPLWDYRSMEHFTLLKLLINEVFNTIKDDRDQSNTIPHFLGRRNIVSSTIAKGTKSYTIGPFEGIWRRLSSSTYSNSTSSLPKQPLDN